MAVGVAASPGDQRVGPLDERLIRADEQARTLDRAALLNWALSLDL